jgi:hypothetical protein
VKFISDPITAEWLEYFIPESVTENGKPTALIFTRRGDKMRPISCRPMRKNEWRLYEESLQNTDKQIKEFQDKDLGHDIEKSRSASVIKSEHDRCLLQFC